MSAHRLYDQCSLYSTADRLIVAPTVKPSSSSADPDPCVLVIDRKTTNLTLEKYSSVFPLPTTASPKKKTIFGVLGWFNDSKDLPQLIVATRKVRVGELPGGHVIWRVDGFEMVNVKHRVLDSDTEYLTSALASVLRTPHFFFCQTQDLTQTRQRLSKRNRSEESKPLFDQSDERFVWNRRFLTPLVGLSSPCPSSVHKFLVPLVHGAVFIHKCSIDGKNFTWSLVSRRSTRKVGTRFFARGIDEKGNTANFVETEQIVEYQNTVSSFVQTRGSMPMYWQMVPDLKYKPKAMMTPRTDSLPAFKDHFREQVPLYGKQVLVNLIDHKKAEGELELSFRNLCEESQLSDQLTYDAFDFHKECKKMRYDRLSILIDRLKPKLNDFEYFFQHPREEESKEQKGVFRTNCMDCLDRTNVVQSLLATENLKLVLFRMGVIGPNKDILQDAGFQAIFKNAWADHANMISVQYAGTGALKTDFTRTGERTKYGMLQDGWNSIVRYVLNTFCDGDRTDNLRYFVGEAKAEDLLGSRGKVLYPGGPLVYLPPVCLLLQIVLVLILVFSPDQVDVNYLLMLVVFIILNVAAVKITFQNGRIWVNYPKTIKYTMR